MRFLGIIDLLSFLPAAIALIAGDRWMLVLFGMLPFLKLVRYSPALRSLLAALHVERRTLFGCVVIDGVGWGTAVGPNGFGIV